MNSYLLSDDPQALELAMKGGLTRLACSQSESPAVCRALENLTRDLKKVAEARISVGHDAAEAQIVIGTIGSPLLTRAVAEGGLDLSPLSDEAGAPIWEAFVIQVVREQLFIVGADRRGTVFGIYEFCETIGVSPWWWFGDVPVRRRDRIAVRRDARYSDHPSVKYRGIFVNDEEELDNWARAHTVDGTIGPELYERIFELILRLGGNYIWPAMHVGGFNLDPENGRLADEMGLVVGSSHCDMLLRSNEREFDPWSEQREEPVTYDYSISGRNRDELLDYWRGSVRQNGSYEVSWTVGMRGIHDSGFITSRIDADEHLSAAEKHAARVDLLGRVIHDQRALLGDELGERGGDCLQIFIPYKEVLPIYDTGLDLPDDITVVWANDNFGYVRRFPSGEELKRPGGHGLYYHSSYWSVPPRSYLATSSTPLALARHELGKSWEHGIRTLWTNNVGAIKRRELEMEFFLRYAWQVGKETTTASVEGFVEQWVDAMFSGDHGKHTGEIYAHYSRLNNQRKHEHLAARTFSQTAYGDEAGRRLAGLRDLYNQTNQIMEALPEDERDSFFQLFALRIHMAYLVNAEFYYADRSTLAFDQGRPAAADDYLALARRFREQSRTVVHFYNHEMSAGKWRGVFSPEQAPPPAMAQYPAGTPALRIGEPGLGIAVWGTDTAGPRPLRFSSADTSLKWIDIFTTGARDVIFEVTANDWIQLSEMTGVLHSDRRIFIRIPDMDRAAGREGTITVRAADESVEIPVVVEPPMMIPSGFSGALEADGCVSLDPGRPDSRRETADAHWRAIEWLGRDGSTAVEARGGSGARLDFNLLLATPGAHVLELHRLPTLDSTGDIRVGVSVDDAPPVVVESPTTDEYRGVWSDAVLDNVERLRIRLPFLPAGAHTLRIHSIDEHVTLSKLVIYTEELRETNLGPPFSRHTERDPEMPSEPDPAAVDRNALESVCRRIYRTAPAQVPAPPVIYAGVEYWTDPKGGTLRRAVRRPQQSGPPWAVTREDGRKNLVARLADGIVEQRAGTIAIDAATCLIDTARHWRSPSLDAEPVGWRHTQAETYGRTGLAMHVDAPGRAWEDPAHAPGMHFTVNIDEGGRHRVWLLIKLSHTADDSCWLALDGTPQPVSEQHAQGALFGWDTTEQWHWSVLSDIDLSPGRHTLSILAREAGLRIARIYLTHGDELPPGDSAWPGPDGSPT